MTLSVSNANPGSISGVGVANPGRISGVGNAPTYYQTGGVNGATAGTFSTTPPTTVPQYSNYDAASFRAFAPDYAAVAPNWNLTDIYNRAGSGAASQVNPYYTQQLQKFQADQAQAKAIQEQQRQLNLQNLTNTYANQLQGNEIGRGRTSQDALANEQQLGIQADYRQQDQGSAFDQARIAQAKQIAGQGLTGSGQGNQQVTQSLAARNTQEQRQGEQDQQAVAHQELEKARTFEDLGRSDVLAGTAKAQGEKQQQIDWDRFINGQSSDLSTRTDELERSRLAQLSTVQKTLAQQDINARIQALSNPAQRQAARQAYGSAF